MTFFDKNVITFFLSSLQLISWDLSNSFDQIIEEDSYEADTTYDLDSSAQLSKHEKLKGLFLLLVSPEYTQHNDMDIQLRVGVCVCKMLKIFCPNNPFSGMLEERSLTKNTLLFILACISKLVNVKNKSDINYPKLHTILYICCQIDVFLWCASLEDEATLFECIKTAFSIVKNINDWAWTEPSVIRQMLLDMVVKVIAQAESLLTREIIIYILELLIEPARSTQPQQHTFARDLVIRTTSHMEYNIQMLLQNALIAGNVEPQKETGELTESKQAYEENVEETSDSDTESEVNGSHQLNPLGEHTFLIIYALHTIQESLVAPILPTIELKLKSPSERERKRSFRLLARLFSEPAKDSSPISFL
ncbi:putative androgen induced inhibitor of proliferation (As3) / pds5 [Fasciola hepatica]|uniref:Androgen induced inhibitor of proliferation (As3) / pds5 n=1 Tax=Fasciola hepatica TaxID=6192 RepID=A0A4E0QZ27_FASHE|nr:putative androgen induced inhibitor of proliferation (As3) / pds5 [Fasciola hepatica]